MPSGTSTQDLDCSEVSSCMFLQSQSMIFAENENKQFDKEIRKEEQMLAGTCCEAVMKTFYSACAPGSPPQASEQELTVVQTQSWELARWRLTGFEFTLTSLCGSFHQLSQTKKKQQQNTEFAHITNS